MKHLKIASWMWFIFWIYFIIYNNHFGWNWHPINETEKMFDEIGKAWFYLTVGVYLYPLAKIYKRAVKNYES